MPDDAIAAEQLTIQTDEEISEAEAAFADEDEEAPVGDGDENSGDDNAPEGEDKKPADDSEKKSDDTTPDDKEDDEKTIEKPDDKADKDDKESKKKNKSAMDMLDDRVGSDGEKKPDGDDASDSKKDPPVDDTKPDDGDDKPEEKTGDSGSWTKEQIAEHLKVISDDELPGEVIIGNDTVDLKKYADEFPEDFSAMKVVAAAVASRIAESALEKYAGQAKPAGEGYAKAEDIQALQQKVSNQEFDMAVAMSRSEDGSLKHPDFFDIKYGGQREAFEGWVKTLPPKHQKLANESSPEDAILLLDAFKEAISKEKVDDFDKKASRAKKRHDAIHATTIRGNNPVKRPASSYSSGDPNAEAEAAFNEDD